MKITQEVRDFAPKQNASADTILEATATPTVRPEPVEGPSFAADGGQEGASTAPDRVRGRTELEAEVEKGMAEMSGKFREKGGEIYLPAAE
jgi:phosphomethylpyrimidine synthase